MELRHEWKHEIGYGDMMALRSRLSAVIKPDPHGVDGRYEIRSLYFDTLQDKALREKLDGVNRREKFRIRYYNGDTSFIQLEKKSKINGLCSKQQAPVSIAEVQRIMEEGMWLSSDTGVRLLDELYRKMKEQGLRPKTLVDYTREAFMYEPGGVRVTLDYNIRTAMNGQDFLNPNGVTVPAGNAPVILEVKWDEFLPSWIRDIVQVPGTHSAAFSKYAACRIYG